MFRMKEAKILVVGLDGVGIEICKNLVLAGIGYLYLVDSELIDLNNVYKNFYLTTQDIGLKVISLINYLYYFVNRK